MMLLRTADRTKLSNWYKVAFDADADKRRCRRENQMVEIRRCKREVNHNKEDREGLKLSQSFPSAIHARKQLKGLSSLVGGVLSDDNNLQLKATTQFCELVSIKRNPPIDEVIQSGVVRRFVEFLMREDFPQLQFEAAWALANIASGTSKGTKVVIDNRALPIFVKLLGSPNADLREQAVFALGIVAGHSPTCRDRVLGHGALVPLLEQLKENSKLSMLRNATWTLSNFCRGKPQPSFKQVRPALKKLQRLLHCDDGEVLTDSCLALSYLSNGTYDEIEEVIKAGVCPRLLQLLLHPSSSVVIPALQTIGNIVTGTDTQTQVILDMGTLGYLLRLLTDNPNKSIKMEACFAISNILAGTDDQIQAVIEAGLIGPLVTLLQTAEFDLRVSAARAISNAAFDGSRERIEYLVSEGCIKPLCDLILSPDPDIVCTCLEGLSNIMMRGGVSRGGVSRYAPLIKKLVCLEKIDDLAYHDNPRISEWARRALHLLEKETDIAALKLKVRSKDIDSCCPVCRILG